MKKQCFCFYSGKSDQHPRAPGGPGSSRKPIRNGEDFVRSIHGRLKQLHEVQVTGSAVNRAGTQGVEWQKGVAWQSAQQFKQVGAKNLGRKSSSTKLKEDCGFHSVKIRCQKEHSDPDEPHTPTHGCPSLQLQGVSELLMDARGQWRQHIFALWTSGWPAKLGGRTEWGSDQGVWRNVRSNSLNCRKFVQVDYLQEQVQETVKRQRYQGGWVRAGQWVPIPVVGNHSLLRRGQKVTPQYTWKGGREGVHWHRGLGSSEKTKQNTKPKNNKRVKGQIKGLPSKPDIFLQKCFVAVQANETMHRAHTRKNSQS